MPISNTIVRDSTIRPLKKNIIVYDMNFTERTLSSGLIVPGDDARERGIRPRWGKVLAVGPQQKDVKEGQWVLVAHGRWTRGIKYELDGEFVDIRMVDPDEVLGVQDETPDDDYVGWSDPDIARRQV